MSANLRGRIERLETAMGTTARMMHIIDMKGLPEEYATESALSDLGINPSEDDFIVLLANVLGDSLPGGRARLVLSRPLAT